MKKAEFLSAISALYKKTEADVTDHLKTVEGDEIDDAKVIDILKGFDAEKVTTLKTEATERFNNGVKKGQKETATRFEKKLKATFEIDEDDLEGDDLLSKVEEIAKAKPSKADPSKIDYSILTPEELAKIPAYINREREWNNKLKEKDTEKENAVLEVKREIKNSAIKSKASRLALSKLNERNPILPKDATKAEKLKHKLLVEELQGYSFMEAEDGTLIPLDEEGKPRQNANGIQVDFDSLVNDIIENNFEFAVAEERKSPGQKNGTPPSKPDGATFTGKAPANSKQYFELLTSKDLSIEEKASVKELYSEQFR